jgi:hypothetical protein
LNNLKDFLTKGGSYLCKDDAARPKKNAHQAQMNFFGNSLDVSAVNVVKTGMALQRK